MPRKVKTQWDFSGELFAPEQTRRVFSVSELTAEVRAALEKQLSHVWVTGEITNLRLQSSGHAYFSLKDTASQLSCVLFRNDRVENREALRDGAKVILEGEITVYEARGQYQLHVSGIELQGIGALQLAFEKLKQKLNAEGLFAAERKRPMPRFPMRVGLVTSPTGAAIRDVLHVAGRRNPSLEFILAPCLVQGPGAAMEIAAAIQRLNEWSAQSPAKLDVILVTRGGGSLEDLWPFNEEGVARAIAASALPVVSAVGHEIDFTISDFTADLRAATPSAAAEILTEDVFAASRWIAQVPGRIRERLRQRYEREKTRVTQLTQRLARAHPRRFLRDRSQHVDDLQSGMSRVLRHELDLKHATIQTLRDRLARVRPSQALAALESRLAEDQRRLREQARHRLQTARLQIENLQSRLRLLSPEHVLARGYSITMDAQTGRIIQQAGQVRPGQSIRTRLQSGEIRSVVEPDYDFGTPSTDSGKAGF
jgi:exodeoxyribonuclease VII large subunit